MSISGEMAQTHLDRARELKVRRDERRAEFAPHGEVYDDTIEAAGLNLMIRWNILMAEIYSALHEVETCGD